MNNNNSNNIMDIILAIMGVSAFIGMIIGVTKPDSVHINEMIFHAVIWAVAVLINYRRK